MISFSNFDVTLDLYLDIPQYTLNDSQNLALGLEYPVLWHE